MKIFYAIQGTGNGHISRAIELYPYLKKYGEVDFFLSGSNAHLNTDLPIKYKSKGLSLFYKHSGGLDYNKIAGSLSFHLYKDAKALPVEKYDLVVNDFEFVSSLACIIKKVPCIHFGHQASFQSKKTPRPNTINPLGNLILENFVKTNQHIGLHFDAYDENIYNPIIKDEILNATPINDGHITVYLPQYAVANLEPHLLQQSKFHFEVFTKEVNRIICKKNITYYPINNKQFTSSMVRCYGIITAGGFETPAEAMYMHKKILSIPILKHYEQECNAAALEKKGVMVLKKIDKNFAFHFQDWILYKEPVSLTLTHSTAQIVELLLNKSKK
ncbi:MAG: hypothetical protein RLZ56_270 [Bacteroidota bacterium]|jgi:uncharacterized protein (TIGR00661 family)